MCIRDRSTPLAQEPWGLSNQMTARALDSIGKTGGPRCCKRDSWLAVQAAVEEQLPKLLRKDIARASIDRNGKIIVAQSLDAAVEIANEIAPEHLELCVEQPFDYLDKIQNAGSVFLGRNCPEALGDYFAGPNHTLPTSGTARFSSPLGVDDFVKKSSFIYYTREALEKAAPRIADFAEREGLHAHARSVTIRYE